MPGKTKIEWAKDSWNPVTGCSKVSPGCAHCYAEELTSRMAGNPGWIAEHRPWTPENAAHNVILRPDRLDQPIKWKRPRMIFVNSMSDLFHEQVSIDFIAQVFAVMALADWHIFQVLTKRPGRMCNMLNSEVFHELMLGHYGDQPLGGVPWPLPNVWLGTSIENRLFVDRADYLRETPAAVRFISAEPLLGPLLPFECIERGKALWRLPDGESVVRDDYGLDLTAIDWLIVGGESGPKHRPIEVEWVRQLRDETRCDFCDGTGKHYIAGAPAGDDEPCSYCEGTGRFTTAFFFKQWGGRTPKAGGRLLDGRTWSELPTVARVASQSQPQGALI